MKILTLQRSFLMLIPTALAAFLLACGGGGGSSSAGTTAPGGFTTLYPRFAYVANSSDNSVSTYAVNAATGRLLFASKVAAGTAPYSVTVDPTGQYAYVANDGNDTISQYTIGSTGTLSAMSPATVAAGTAPYSVTTTGSYQ
ncbi:MAG: beta-propeller fold lactonase family protein [Acidiferrobacterales bacterium]